MATVQYPPFLPLPQRADQNMTQDTAWQTTQTAVGPAIFTPITTDLKATWTLQWIFTLAQAERFKSWLRSPTYCDRGRNWFQMPIDLGDTQGVQQQTLHFVSMPVQTSKNGSIVTWCQQRVKSDPLTATTNGLILIHLVYSGLASAITPAFRFCFSR
ncbi:hypothetical protein [Klebsiella oxytoca]|uniref:hypothetical protein n=1 Tax=Klebsiella oxytoca TaxID=571 RepID=UPI00287F7489|nr:hypothetical protein [Klebsiella oxytoca]